MNLSLPSRSSTQSPCGAWRPPCRHPWSIQKDRRSPRAPDVATKRWQPISSVQEKQRAKEAMQCQSSGLNENSKGTESLLPMRWHVKPKILARLPPRPGIISAKYAFKKCMTIVYRHIWYNVIHMICFLHIGIYIVGYYTYDFCRIYFYIVYVSIRIFTFTVYMYITKHSTILR